MRPFNLGSNFNSFHIIHRAGRFGRGYQAEAVDLVWTPSMACRYRALGGRSHCDLRRLPNSSPKERKQIVGESATVRKSLRRSGVGAGRSRRVPGDVPVHTIASTPASLNTAEKYVG
jgi:hypothetical protein